MSQSMETQLAILVRQGEEHGELLRTLDKHVRGGDDPSQGIHARLTRQEERTDSLMKTRESMSKWTATIVLSAVTGIGAAIWNFFSHAKVTP